MDILQHVLENLTTFLNRSIKPEDILFYFETCLSSETSFEFLNNTNSQSIYLVSGKFLRNRNLK